MSDCRSHSCKFQRHHIITFSSTCVSVTLLVQVVILSQFSQFLRTMWQLVHDIVNMPNLAPLFTSLLSNREEDNDD